MQPCKTTRFHTFSNSSTNCMNSVFLLVLIIFQSTSLSSQPTIKILKLKENILHHFTPRGDQNINYLYSINTISSSQVTKKAKKFYLWDYHLIQHQILITNLIINVWQTVRRIFFKILWVKGLRELTVKKTFFNHSPRVGLCGVDFGFTLFTVRYACVCALPNELFATQMYQPASLNSTIRIFSLKLPFL